MINFSDANQYSPLVLAFIGDAVYDLIIKSIVISKGNAPVNKLQKETKKYVQASEQASICRKIMDILTEEEMTIYKRGRNTKSSVPKNASISDYRTATGLEALIGYLYITNNIPRIMEILAIGIENK